MKPGMKKDDFKNVADEKVKAMQPMMEKEQKFMSKEMVKP